MNIDAPSPVAQAPPPSSSASNILQEESQICWKTKVEKDAFKKLKTQRFVHTTTYDPLLQATGMDGEFDFVFRAVGWDGFWNVVEQGV